MDICVWYFSPTWCFPYVQERVLFTGPYFIKNNGFKILISLFGEWGTSSIRLALANGDNTSILRELITDILERGGKITQHAMYNPQA